MRPLFMTLALFAFSGMLPKAFGLSESKTKGEALPKTHSLNLSISFLASAHLGCGEQSQCLAVPIGRKPCGGPQRFVVTSEKNLHLGSIHALSEELIEVMAQKASEDGPMFGPCVMALHPTLECHQGVCKATP